MKKDISEFNYMWTKIEKNFGWQRVHDVIGVLNWDYEGEYPDLPKLKDKAKEVLLEAFFLGEGQISSGGFVGECTGEGLHLSFVVEEVFTGDF